MSKRYMARDFLKTKKVLTFSPDDSLSKALSSLRSGHDAAFVVSGDKKLLGIINPYYVNFHGNFPPATKLKRCMMMPPKLSLNSSLEKILHNMLESKLYFLPVLDKEKRMLGILSLRNMLKTILKNIDIYQEVLQNLQIQPVETIKKTQTLSQVRSILKKNKISRMPIVDNRGKLIGIITRYDLRMALSSPKNSQDSSSRKGKKIRELDTEIERFMTKPVITSFENSPLSDLVKLMFSHMVGSVVIVNDARAPLGMVTYREIIKSLLQSIKLEKYPLHINTPKDFLYKSDLDLLLREKLNTLQKKRVLKSIGCRLTVGKDIDSSYKWVEVVIKVETRNSTYFARVRGKGWRKSVSSAFEKISKQITK